jgi:hypothetical protein
LAIANALVLGTVRAADAQAGSSAVKQLFVDARNANTLPEFGVCLCCAARPGMLLCFKELMHQNLLDTNNDIARHANEF